VDKNGVTNGTPDAITGALEECKDNEVLIMNAEYRKFAGALVFCFALISDGAADGYRNPPPTAEGIGKSGVHSVFVNDASAISYNPANLASQTNASFVGSFTFARTENQYSPFPGVSADSDAKWNVLPNLYYSQPLGDSGMTAGIGLTSPFGQGISWNRSDFIPAATPTNPVVPYEAQLALININPTVAFRLVEDLSIGVGLDLYVSRLSLTAVNLNPAPPPPNFDSEVEAYGVGIGGNIGVTWDINEAHHVAATYRSAFEIDYSGDFKAEGIPTADVDTTIKFPNIYTLGYGVDLNEAIQVEIMVEWLQWSNNEEQTLEIEGVSQTFENNWDDTFTVGLGGNWQLNESWAVRAGYAFIETPIPDSTITPLLPDADRHAFSLGAGYTLGKHTIDAAYTFSIYDDRDNTASGAYEIDSDLVGMTYSYTF
jgi:long-chain fatty acid transport protein